MVGHLGRALITLGLMMFGFVAYQLWGTGLETLRAQSDLESDFNRGFDELGITPDTLAPASSAPVITTTTAPTPSDASAPGTSTPGTSTPGTSTPDSVEPPVVTEPTATTVEPVPQNYGQVLPSDVLGRIKIPDADVDFYYVAGVSVQALRHGVGHFPNTPLPGQLGNAALAGHRTSHLAPFEDLDQLQIGDEIQIFTAIGDAYAYNVTDIFVVNPSDYQVVTDSDPNVATLTLITCTPKYTSQQRLVIKAVLDPSRGSPVGQPTLFYGEDPATVDTSVDATLPPEETVRSTDAPASTTAESSAVPETTGAAVTPTTDGATSAIAEFTEDDAFSQGWFDDGAAWPHVIGWAALLAAVWYGCYRLAKRYRRLWLGIVVGIVPFIAVLYLFYENVNRLLPAAI